MKPPKGWPDVIETIVQAMVFSFVAWLIFKSCTQ